MCSPYNSLTDNPEHRVLICALCVEWVSYDDLHIDPADGLKVDICETCFIKDQETLRRKEAGLDPYGR